MPVTILKGNIFTSKMQTLVNPVNCIGVMGTGLALEFKLRYPEMNKRYQILCQRKMFKSGMLWIYQTPDKKIINFPTKTHWKHPSKLSYLSQGLKKFKDTYIDKNITSIAFPLLGTDNGGLNQESVQDLMLSLLYDVEINIEIYRYDPESYDDLFLQVKKLILETDINRLSQLLKINASILKSIRLELKSNEYFQVYQLMNINGVGQATIERIFFYMFKSNSIHQNELFN